MPPHTEFRVGELVQVRNAPTVRPFARGKMVTILAFCHDNRTCLISFLDGDRKYASLKNLEKIVTETVI